MIYMDNSATTNPKPRSVIESVNLAMHKFSFNSGRGGYRASVDTAAQIFSVREKVAELIGFQPQNIAFTPNCTLALNMAIKGAVKKGDHVIISDMEHNAVARPVESLALKNFITYDVFEYSYDKDKIINNIKGLIKPNTRLIVCTQASNVFGCVMPVYEIGALAKENGILFVVDGAQGAGVLKINCMDANVDVYCSAGHKGLYGPMGTGFMAAAEGVKLNTIIEGGTGSSSLQLEQPDFMPDRFESGTLNNSGIIGLGAGINFVNRKGIDAIYAHEHDIVAMIYNALSKMPDVTLYTPSPNQFDTAPILSFNYKDYSSERTAALLAEKSIAVRAGLHCAPLAHKTFKTIDRGTVRVSPSVFTNMRQCEIFINTLKKL
ncbi:MAG: aminotransferase class V-fold PLP-dependent enzyme [Clostridium sp.]|nr:aminotransferase class V-fold PLP-dependent enzyme [Clostridium sp.]